MPWVRFHEELCEDEKASIPRAFRFVYMQLSLKARPRKGFIVLPQGLEDIKAVQLILPGNPREVADAIKLLSRGPDPMIRFEDREGKRVLIVVNWARWNPSSDDSGPRVKRFRESKRNGDSNGSSNGDTPVSETGSSRSVTSASAGARATLLSSPLDSDLPERESGVVPTRDEPERESGVMAASRAERVELVQSWCDGIGEHRGATYPFPWGRPFTAVAEAMEREARRLGHTSAMESLAWAKALGAEYSAARAGREATSIGFPEWLGSGRPKAVVKASVQPATAEPTWKQAVPNE